MKLKAKDAIKLFNKPKNEYKLYTDESNDKYNGEYLSLANQYISEVIEPLIISVAHKETEISLPSYNIMEEDIDFKGNSIEFSDKYNSLNSYDLTNTILNILKVNGYKCKFNISYNYPPDERLGWQTNYGKLIISWI